MVHGVILRRFCKTQIQKKELFACFVINRISDISLVILCHEADFTQEQKNTNETPAIGDRFVVNPVLQFVTHITPSPSHLSAYIDWSHSAEKTCKRHDHVS